MTAFDTSELLIASGVITRELAQRAAQIAPATSASRVGRLIAAGADGKRVLESLAQSTGIPLAPSEMLEWATPVLILPSTARQLRDILACPVRRDAQGVLHVIICDPETASALERLLIDFRVYLAPEASVQSLLHTLYSMGPAGAPPLEPIEIDLETSRRNVRAPLPEAIDIDMDASRRMPAARAAPPSNASSTSSTSSASSAASASSTSSTSRTSSDPLAARPSGSFKRPVDNEETQRVQRSPRAPSPPLPALTPAEAPSLVAPALAPSLAPAIAVMDDATIANRRLAAPAIDAAERRAFQRGALLGAAVTAALAAIVIAALLAR